MDAVVTARKRAAVKPTGAARIPKPSQGWYRDPETGEKLRRVTTILEQGVPKDGLVHWAGNTVAQCAIDNIPTLVASSRSTSKRAELYDWLKAAHTRKKDERGTVGSAVHKLVEAHVLEQPLPDELLDDPEMAPYLEQFLAFVRDFNVTFEASEMVVANTAEGYAGTLDYLTVSEMIVKLLIERMLLAPESDPAMPLLGDTKTGGEICWGDGACVRIRPYEFKRCPKAAHAIKGVYPEAGLQMSAYRHADVCWLRDGTKVAMPATHPVGIVLQLRPEGYLVHPVRCDEAVFGYFKHARVVAEWTSQHGKTVIGDPLTLHNDSRKAA